MVTVADRLRALRESLGISQAKLAEICGTNQSSINRYEHAQSEAPYKVLLWYANYFDVSLDYVFGRTDKPEGAKYDNQPDALIKKIENTDEYRDFIEACFDPRSPMNARLKEMLLSLAEKPLMSVAENGAKYGQEK